MLLKQVKTGKEKKVIWSCPNCGYTVEAGKEKMSVQTEETKETALQVLDSDIANLKTMPTVEIECPKCGNDKAYWWLVQTRSGDEPPTIFYRCTKCGYTWRQYS
ncbi:Transcription factor S [Conexivisphaera calida]|uniref:Transcription factor S n=2 Tax=Conexivisphaera calida TaxID=1874277 RepID=A0A4P2VCP1_9ARCH|nr:Transcription factor S [Conexivisphaera calida]